MKILLYTILTSLALCVCASKEEISASNYLKSLNTEIIRRRNLEAEANWAFYSNITDENERKQMKMFTENAKFLKKVSQEIKQFNWKNYQSQDLKRQFKILSKLDYEALNDEDYAEHLKCVNSMYSNYAKVKICEYENKTKCDLHLEPEIEDVIAKSRDPDKLKYYWREFYDKAGTPTRKAFEKYVELSNKAAKLNGYKSNAEMWLNAYEDSTIEKQLVDIMEGIKPLYLQIHGYVRYRLRQYYGDNVVSETGPIPMHLLGNMWAEQWSQIADIVSPFPNKPTIDVSQEMVKQGYTPLKIFQMGDDFFTSMGLKKLPQNFWNKSILEKPIDGRDMLCHASAWDLYSIDDVRIKQCTRVSQQQFIIAHHELGHIQYFMQYQHQPYIYRTGANPGFHEAIGNVVGLSVSTPKHLERVGLVKSYVRDHETRIKQLFWTALDMYVFLPFAYSIDKYRWALFRGEIDKSQWNCAFWKFREEYSGIEPPVVRTESDFDPPAKMHISSGIEYLRYLVSFIVQFQFYKSACIKAGQYDPSNPELPLDNCDFYGSTAVGESFAKMLSMGASKPWPEALEAFNGERKMSGEAIAEYFEPLRVWLEAENKKNNVTTGWTKSKKCVPA